jgi:hypothetical protein
MSRDKRRYYKRISDFQYANLTLDDVTQYGNTANLGAYFDGDLQASGYVKGDGSQLTNLEYMISGALINLNDIVINGNTVSRGAKFNGDLEASGNVIGDGSQLTNLAYMTGASSLDLDDVVVNGNTVSRGAKFNGDLEASGNVIGDGSLLTNLPYVVNTLALDLDDIVVNGNTVTRGAKFNGDLEASGNVIGDGSQLTNLAYMTGAGSLDLDDVVVNGNTVSRGAKFNGDLEATGNVIADGSQLTNLPYVVNTIALDLDDVVVNGNTVTRGAKFNGDLEASGNVIGDGSQLTNLGYMISGALINLNDIVVNGNTVTRGAKFVGDLEASGNVIGNGSLLTNLGYMTNAQTLDLDDVVVNGNTVSRGAKFNGDLQATGLVKGNGSQLTNLGYMTNAQTLDLDDVVVNGNTVSRGAKFNGDLEATGNVIADGSLLTNLGYMTSTGLNDVTTQGSSTNYKVNFTNSVTSFQTSGDMNVSGNVTCHGSLKGNGEFLTGVANSYNLSILNTSITSLENSIIITNTSSLTNVSRGDILVSGSNGTLGKLPIGTNGKVLYSNNINLQPEWKTFTDIFDIPNRTSALESKSLFTITPNISSLVTGDILYGYANNDLRRFSRQTTAPNTYLTSGDYGTGYGRLLRMDEIGENIMWLHPTTGLDLNNSSSNAIFHVDSVNPAYLKIRTLLTETPYDWPDRITISSTTKKFDIKFCTGMFYSRNGVSHLDTDSGAVSYPGHPNNVKYNWYLLGNLRITGTFHGDGSGLFRGSIARPASSSNAPRNVGTAPILGKDGALLTYSDRRRKSNIKNISNALEKLTKLVPKIYDTKGKRKSGFIAQEVYYNARELRHIVWPDRDASPNDDAPEKDYSDWGTRSACLRYPHLIAYIVKSIQELRVRIEKLKNNKE